MSFHRPYFIKVVLPFSFRRSTEDRPDTSEHTRKAVAMWLESVLLGLESPGDEDWMGRTQIVERCLSELKSIRKKQADGGERTDDLDRAVLNIRAMTMAMKQRDRLMAVETGKSACAALSHESARKSRRG